MDIRLNGSQFKELSDALIEAFPAYDDLERMLRFQLDKSLAAISLGRNMKAVLFDVISDAQARGWTARLIAAARAENPDNDRIQAFAQKFGLASSDVPKAELERIVARSSRFLDVGTWTTKLIEMEACVCRVEVPVGRGSVVYGTGFLVGPATVLTNYHVVEAAILGAQGKTTAKGLASQPSSVILRFGYKRTNDGIDIAPGIEYKLDPDPNRWLIDASKPSGLDTQSQPVDQQPAKDELDYALLRLADPAGNHLVNSKALPGPNDQMAPTRGWINMPAEMPDVASDGSILILQHPSGAPLKLAIGTDAYEGINGNGTRLRYTVSTLGGSSGSPVFNIDWDLIALHHLGDPNFAENAKFNQGILVAAIRALLEQRGKASALDEANS